MHVRRIALAAAAVALVAVTPAHADEPVVTGFNTGDAGLISLTFATGATTDANDPTQGSLDAKCEYHQVTTPSNDNVTLVVAGHGVAGPRNDARAIGTTVRCVLINQFNNSVVFDDEFGNEGPATVWVPQTKGTLATSYKVCATASALYSDGTYISNTALRCINPI